MNPRFTALTLALIAGLLSVSACFTTQTGKVRNNSVPSGVNVLLPTNVANAESDSSVLKESAVIVSVPMENEYYVGDKRFVREDLRNEIGKLLKPERTEVPEGTRDATIVYIAGGINVKNGTIVNVLRAIRTPNIKQIGLLVEPKSANGNAPAILRVQVLAEPDPNEDISKLNPNPLMLVVSIASDGKLKLNQEPMGSTTDTANLSQFLSRIFRQRKEQGAYRPETRDRTDLTEDERVEKTIFIKADESVAYGEVIRAIDAVKGAGANPIVVQLEEVRPVVTPSYSSKN